MTSTMDFGATSETATTDAHRYLKEVAPHLAALPAEERADLLDDLAQHLREIAAEPGPPLAERLGAPEAYAAELLASAGVAAESRPHRPLLSRATSLFEAGRASWVGQEAVRMGPVVRPAWWVIRAYLVVSLISSRDSYGSLIPQLGGSAVLGLLAVLVAVPLSVRLGQRGLVGAGRLAVIGANVVLFVYALTLLDSGGPQVRYVDSGSSTPQTGPGHGCLATVNGERITNLYAYDTEGRLLDPVLLYDQNGRPIDNLCPQFDERGRRLSNEYRQDVNGAPVINAFPRRQAVIADTREPSRPGAAASPDTTVPVKPPAVVVPRLSPSTSVTSTTSATVTPPAG